MLKPGTREKQLVWSYPATDSSSDCLRLGLSQEMKFSQCTVLLIGMSSAVMVSAVKKRKKDPAEAVKKGKKGPDECLTCEQTLPGYSFFGELVNDRDFYELGPADLDTFFQGLSEEERFFYFDTISPLCTAWGPESFFFCKLMSDISETIYESDVLSCLVTSLAKTARESICFLYGAGEGPFGTDAPTPGSRARKLSVHQQKVARKLSGDDMATEEVAPFLDLFLSLGISSGYEVAQFLGLDLCGIVADIDDDIGFLKLAGCHSGSMHEMKKKGIFDGGRKTQEEGLLSAEYIEKLSQYSFFFGKCLPEADPFMCMIVFSILKALDAIMCRYQETCSIAESCTADLKFKTEYSARSLGNFLPTPNSPLFLADIIAPCTECAVKESDGCAVFCDYVDGFHQCDPAKTLFYDLGVLVPSDMTLTNFGDISPSTSPNTSPSTLISTFPGCEAQLVCNFGCGVWEGSPRGCDQEDANFFCTLITGNPSSVATTYDVVKVLDEPGVCCPGNVFDGDCDDTGITDSMGNIVQSHPTSVISSHNGGDVIVNPVCT
jgi:hypothetical protein